MRTGYIFRGMPRPTGRPNVDGVFRPLRPSQLAVDAVLAGAYGLVTIPVEIVLNRSADTNALSATLVTVIFAGALILRRWAPGLALGVAWVAAIVQMAFQRPPSVGDLAIFAVLYAAAAYGSRRVFWFGFASALGGALVITLYLFWTNLFAGVEWSTISVALAVMVAASFALLLSWTVGALVRAALQTRETRLAEQAAAVEARTEQERVRIARDMHDVVAHSLAVIVAQADGARYASTNDPAAAPAALETISSTARAALTDVRVLLAQLRHSQGDGPQPGLDDLVALYADFRASGMDLRVNRNEPVAQPSAAVQRAVYRIVQEALTNTLRHGAAAPVDVEVIWGAQQVSLRIVNTRADARTVGPGGHGLIGMRERAHLVGGALESGPVADRWYVRAVLPLGAPS